MVDVLFAALAGGVAGGLIAFWRHRRGTRRAHATGGAAAVTPSAAVRQEGEVRWRRGGLVVTAGAAVWRPRSGDRDRTFRAGRTSVRGARWPGLAEQVVLNPVMVVLQLDDDGGPLELAVFPQDLDLVMNALPAW